MPREVSAIERESYRILQELCDLSHLEGLSRQVAERVIHATADTDYAHDLVLDERALASGLEALEGGASIVADSTMTLSGIAEPSAACYLEDRRARELARSSGLTRSAAGVRVAFDEVGQGAIWVIGSAPTALFELLRLSARPALVVGLCVGFVGSAQAKQVLVQSGLACVSNRSAKGGSAAAAAAINALCFKRTER